MAPISEPTNSLLEERQVYVLYKYRFLIVIVYIIASNLNEMMFAVLASLQSTLVNIYDEDLTYVNVGTLLIDNIALIPASFFSNYIVDTYGLKIGFLIGTILNLTGLCLRCFSLHGFGWIFAGQLFAGIAGPFFSTTPQKVSSVWFGPSERALATTTMMCGKIIGNAVGRIIPQWFIDIKADDQIILDQLQKMFFNLAIFSSVCYVFTLTFMKDKPPTPPSKAAAAAKLDYARSLKTLLMDKNTMMMIIATAIINGTIDNYANTIQQVLEPLGIDGYQVSDVIAIALFITPVGFFGGAAVIAKFKKYNLTILVLSVLCLGALVLNLYAAGKGNVYFYGATAIIYGITTAPVAPIALEYATELAFPVAEATIGGVWSIINQISSTGESLVIDSILGKHPTRGDAVTTFIIIAGFQALATTLLFFVKERLKRKKFESKNKDLEDARPEINASFSI